MHFALTIVFIMNLFSCKRNDNSSLYHGEIHYEYVGNIRFNKTGNKLVKEFTYIDTPVGYIVFRICGSRFSNNEIPDISALTLDLQLFDIGTSNRIYQTELAGTNMNLSNWCPPDDSFFYILDTYKTKVLEPDKNYRISVAVKNPVIITNNIEIWIKGKQSRRL